MIEFISKAEKFEGRRIKAAVFDFDGTISTLRSGWEKIMSPLFYRMINGNHAEDAALKKEVDAYIDESTGIQTIFQMRWLVQKVGEYGRNSQVLSDWDYKDMYNQELLESVNKKIAGIKSGALSADNYIIDGSRKFLAELKKRGLKLFVASGTDDADVKNECKILGFAEYFDKIIGAPPKKADCSKEAILNELINGGIYKPDELVVFGDGKVEIQLASQAGAIAIGTATDENLRHGVNSVKRAKLIRAGADIIVGDFGNCAEILSSIKTF
ncbi:hypothetical protein FACS1894211_09080 [Clostridia bacterium]|nr:hypothetical protein FACS1894211_09080 [Clostridia bacterium]